VIAQIATGAYESFGPSAEARKILEKSEHARTIIGILVGREQLQAAELRSIVGIEHQSMIARIMHTLSKARLVTVERGPGNTAWYRLTPEGRRAAKAFVGRESDGVRHDADGDTHGWLKVDPQYQSLLNAGNDSNEGALQRLR
jgi:DNA-binding PadR family transcriptional regulator